MMMRPIIVDRPVGRPLKSVLRAKYLGMTPAYFSPFGWYEHALPDFIIIGAQRAGTTSLHDYLSQHHQLVPSLYKEVHFFDLKYKKGMDWYRRNFCTRSHLIERGRKTGSPQFCFETTPYYLYHPAVPGRVKAHLPAAKFIVLLRNPVERALSQYWNERRKNFERLNFEEAVEEEPERLAGEIDYLMANEDHYSYFHHHQSYIDRGRYDRQLDRWLAHFPKQRFLFLKSENLFSDPAATLNQVTGFLGLEPLRHTGFKPLNSGSRQFSVADDLRDSLNRQFRPHNKRLAEMTGLKIDWN